MVDKVEYSFEYDEDDAEIILELSEAAGYKCDIDFMNDMVNETIKNLIKKKGKKK